MNLNIVNATHIAVAVFFLVGALATSVLAWAH